MNKFEVLRSPFFAVASLASGLALVIAIFFRIPLRLTLGSLALLVGLLVIVKVSYLSVPLRMRLKAQTLMGIRIGIIATVSYDVSRFLLVTLGNLNFHPFETFVLFGYALIGEHASRPVALTVGTMYHYLNGVAFAVGYCLLVGGRHWTLGIVWALLLEAAMFTLYPGWLDLQAVMLEFTLVSVTGHLMYGTVLGGLSQHWFRTQRKT